MDYRLRYTVQASSSLQYDIYWKDLRQPNYTRISNHFSLVKASSHLKGLFLKIKNQFPQSIALR